ERAPQNVQSVERLPELGEELRVVEAVRVDVVAAQARDDTCAGEDRRTRTAARVVPELEVHEVRLELREQRLEAVEHVHARRELGARQQRCEVLPLLVVAAFAADTTAPADGAAGGERGQ